MRYVCSLLCVCFLLFGACKQGNVGSESTKESSQAHIEGSFAYDKGEPVKQTADRFLRLTEPFRDYEGHPQWKTLTSDRMDEVSVDSVAPDALWRIPRVRLFCRSQDFHLTIHVDPGDSVLRRYSFGDHGHALEADVEAGRLAPPKLMPGEALERAKAYVVLGRGRFPEELVPVSVKYDFPPDESEREEDPEWRQRPGAGDWGEWRITFERYAGRFEYEGEKVFIRFSERYGVIHYSDSYVSKPWQGKVSISQDEALAVAAEHFDGVWADPRQGTDARPRHGEEGKEEDRRTLILELPTYVDGPYLTSRKSAPPRTVRATWHVVYQRPTIYRGGNFVGSDTMYITILVDAENGEYIGFIVASTSGM